MPCPSQDWEEYEKMENRSQTILQKIIHLEAELKRVIEIIEMYFRLEEADRWVCWILYISIWFICIIYMWIFPAFACFLPVLPVFLPKIISLWPNIYTYLFRSPYNFFGGCFSYPRPFFQIQILRIFKFLIVCLRFKILKI